MCSTGDMAKNISFVLIFTLAAFGTHLQNVFSLSESDMHIAVDAASNASMETNIPLSSKSPRLINEQPTISGVTFSKERVKYIEGYPDGSFKPDDGVTRSEAAAMLFRLVVDPNKDAPIPVDARMGCSDVTGEEWFGHYALYATANGIMRGYPGGVFRPEAYMTRSEFATVLALSIIDNHNLSYGTSMLFTDIPADHWAYMYISACASFGWVEGYADGTFRPEEPITRAEAVAILNRALGRGAPQGDLFVGVPKYIDLVESHWAYYQIMEATVHWPALAHDGQIGYEGGGYGGGVINGESSEANNYDTDAGDKGDVSIIPGELIVEMKEKTDASAFLGMFPELRIEYIVDLYEKAKSDLGGGPINLSNKTIFYIKLEERSVENVFAAIDIVSKHPDVKYAEPNETLYRTNKIVDLFLYNYEFIPGVVLLVVDPRMDVDEIQLNFPDIQIEDAIRIESNYHESIGQDVFYVILSTKTKESTYEAVELFLSYPNVISAELDYTNATYQ